MRFGELNSVVGIMSICSLLSCQSMKAATLTANCLEKFESRAHYDVTCCVGGKRENCHTLLPTDVDRPWCSVWSVREWQHTVSCPRKWVNIREKNQRNKFRLANQLFNIRTSPDPDRKKELIKKLEQKLEKSGNNKGVEVIVKVTFSHSGHLLDSVGCATTERVAPGDFPTRVWALRWRWASRDEIRTWRAQRRNEPCDGGGGDQVLSSRSTCQSRLGQVEGADLDLCSIT